MISRDEIRKVSRLAKLHFSEENVSNFAADMNNIMVMIDNLTEIDTSDVEPLRSVLDMQQRFDEDVVKVSDISEDLFQNVPDQGKDLANGLKCFIVPKVIE